MWRSGGIQPFIHNLSTRRKLKVKLKESHNRPGVAQRVPGGLGSQISMTFGTWRWWGCQPRAPAAFTPRKYSWCNECQTPLHCVHETLAVLLLCSKRGSFIISSSLKNDTLDDVTLYERPAARDGAVGWHTALQLLTKLSTSNVPWRIKTAGA